MADEGMTITGLTELRALVSRFPERVQQTCARVAKSAATAMLVDARRRLQSPVPATKGPHEHISGETMAEAIAIVEDAANKQYRVVSTAPSQYPANVVLFREYGTSHEPARPYMAPAGAAQVAPYARDMTQAIASLARELGA